MFSSLFSSAPTTVSASHISPSTTININRIHCPDGLVQLMVGNATFMTTAKTLRAFAPHRLSLLLEDCMQISGGVDSDTKTIFVDQDPASFGRVLQFLRTGGMTGQTQPVFLDELKELELWNLYEANRDYYKIEPLNKALEERLFPQKKQTSSIWKFVSTVINLIGSTLGFKEFETLATELDQQVEKDPILNGSLDKENVQGDFLDLEKCKTEFRRYDKSAEKTRSICKILALYCKAALPIILSLLPNMSQMKNLFGTKNKDDVDTETDYKAPESKSEAEVEAEVEPDSPDSCCSRRNSGLDLRQSIESQVYFKFCKNLGVIYKGIPEPYLSKIHDPTLSIPKLIACFNEKLREAGKTELNEVEFRYKCKVVPELEKSLSTCYFDHDVDDDTFALLENDTRNFIWNRLSNSVNSSIITPEFRKLFIDTRYTGLEELIRKVNAILPVHDQIDPANYEKFAEF